MSDTVLIVIAMQRDYFASGRKPLPDMERALARAARLIGLFRANAMPVIHVRHLEHDPAVGFLLEGTPGADIDPRVAPQGDDVLVTKHYPNAFRDTNLAKVLHVQGAKELFFCGATSNRCIDSTVRAAFDMGYRCTVIEDAMRRSRSRIRRQRHSRPAGARRLHGRARLRLRRSRRSQDVLGASGSNLIIKCKKMDARRGTAEP